MKIWLLILSAVFVFALGYRFFAKLLLTGIFVPDSQSLSQYSPDYGEKSPHRTSTIVSFAHFVSILMGACVVPAVSMAVLWGWVPAYLWIISGTITVGSAYLMGSLWLSHQPGAPGLLDSSRLLVSPLAASVFRALRNLVLLILMAVLLWMSTWILARYPAISWAIIGQLLLALWLQGHWRKKGQQLNWAVHAPILGILILLLVLGHAAPLQFSGALSVSLAGTAYFRIDGTAFWGLFVLLTSLALSRAPFNGAIQSRGWLSAVFAAAFMLVLLTGLVISPPTIHAPEFNVSEALPGRFPWLFVVLSSGAFAGIYALFAHPVAVANIRHTTDLQRWGFGAAIAVGVLALLTWIILITNQADTESWKIWMDQGKPWLPLNLLLGQIIHHGAILMAATGLDEASCRSLIALALAGLTLSTLDTVMLLLVRETQSVSAPLLGRWLTINCWKIWLATAVLILLAAAIFTSGPLSLNWLLFGPASYYIAACVFSLMCLQIGQRMRLWPMMIILAVICWIMGTWVMIGQILSWWTFSPLLLIVAAALFLLASAFVGLAAWKIVGHLQPDKA